MLTIGEQLKQAREARKLTIKQAVAGTRVRAHYLQAMETDEFSAMPSAAQARGFLRLYAEFLGLNADQLTNVLRAETGTEIPAPIEEPVPEAQPKEEAPVPAVVSSTEKVIEKEPGPPTPSQTIFNEIGQTLHVRRELISLTLEEIERHTRVRKHNLDLIESGNFDELPSPVQARGILSAYASFLDMDTDAVLLRYADALQARRIERQPDGQASRSSASRARSGVPFWLRRFISPDLIFGGSMILILLALSIWAATRIFSDGTQTQTTPTQGPSISDVLLATPATSSLAGDTTQVDSLPTSVDEPGTPLPTIDPAEVTPSETAQATVSSAVQITVVVLERTFLRIIVDGDVQLESRTSPGAALTFDGNERIEILTGSGSAVQIIFNQANLGVMGSFGEVVNRIYTINGVETPTPTPSPTPSITPKPSVTPKPSLTLRPSATLRPSSTPRPTSTARPGTTPGP